MLKPLLLGVAVAAVLIAGLVLTGHREVGDIAFGLAFGVVFAVAGMLRHRRAAHQR
jgi:hypothetical protein